MNVRHEMSTINSEATLSPPQFLRGHFIETRSLDEILATLDADGKFDGVPFMPEMEKYCGRRFRVSHRADKTCVEGYGVRRMNATVFLEDLRCDGSAHDGCQRNCLIFWKEAWLKSVDNRHAGSSLPVASGCPTPHWLKPIDKNPAESADTGDASLRAGASPGLFNVPTRKGDQYFCQSTELAGATRDLPRWNVQHFVTDLRHGEISLGRLIRIVGRMAANRIRKLIGLRTIGSLAGLQQSDNSKGDLNLQPGEWVEVKSAGEIQATLDSNGKNRGLSFEPDMVEYCGGRFVVDFPIRKIILEETGRMADLKHTVVLKGVNCQGLCAKNCPRSNPLYWREIWLQRFDGAGEHESGSPIQDSA